MYFYVIPSKVQLQPQHELWVNSAFCLKWKQKNPSPFFISTLTEALPAHRTNDSRKHLTVITH